MQSQEAGGPGGNWKALNESAPATILKQQDGQSCVAACGELLVDGQVTQAQLHDKIGAPSSPKPLAEALNSSSSGNEWLGGFFALPEDAWRILQQHNRPWGAVVRGWRGMHMVVVDGLNESGQVSIRDPWDGTSYLISEAEFLANLRGGVYRR